METKKLEFNLFSKSLYENYKIQEKDIFGHRQVGQIVVGGTTSQQMGPAPTSGCRPIRSESCIRASNAHVAERVGPRQTTLMNHWSTPSLSLGPASVWTHTS